MDYAMQQSQKYYNKVLDLSFQDVYTLAVISFTPFIWQTPKHHMQNAAAAERMNIFTVSMTDSLYAITAELITAATNAIASIILTSLAKD